MKEYTEIEIFNSKVDAKLILENNKYLKFQFADKELNEIVGGIPRELKGGNIIKFSTQGFYERISLNIGNTGSKLEIYDSKKEKKLCDGIVKQKYFEPANNLSWKRKLEHNQNLELNQNNTDEIEINLKFTSIEKEILDLGITPVRMEDKWLSFMSNNTIHLIRSWTGLEIFRANFEKAENGDWLIKKLLINRDWNGGLEYKKSLFKNNLLGQINWIKELIN